ncbi:MAG: DUF2029 domain-containing protein [Actinobacteria bacterium]|nr:DUF2029 domain-containing protein [Actinomycetota bacterium]
MRARSVVLSAFALTLLSCLLAYLKFARCIPGGWISPDVYLQGCYSDITALYEARRFASDLWPYGSGADSLEYPILTGLGIWLISLITPDGSTGLLRFYQLNVMALSLLYFLATYLLVRREWTRALLFALSPAVIAALFINWDIWAIAPFLLSLFFLERRRYVLSGTLLSISIFLKFFPVIFALPILLYLRGERVNRNAFIKGLSVTSLLVNFPFLVANFEGWAKFYLFNYQRGVDFGSIWYLISLRGSWITHLNELITPLVLALALFIYSRYRDQLFGSFFLVAAIFFTLNKVYSPQYVLWLSVAALLYFPRTKLFYLLFALWQGGELLYQFGIWRYLLTILEESGGITTNSYLLISLIRIGSLLVLTGYAVYLLENYLMKSRRSKTNI